MVNLLTRKNSPRVILETKHGNVELSKYVHLFLFETA